MQAREIDNHEEEEFDLKYRLFAYAQSDKDIVLYSEKVVIDLSSSKKNSHPRILGDGNHGNNIGLDINADLPCVYFHHAFAASSSYYAPGGFC
jgi:hypothetical protein